MARALSGPPFLQRANGLPELGVKHEVIEDEVPEFAGSGQTLRAERFTDAGFGVVRMVDVEMNPPRSVIVVEVMIKIPQISAESRRVSGHDVER